MTFLLQFLVYIFYFLAGVLLCSLPATRRSKTCGQHKANIEMKDCLDGSLVVISESPTPLSPRHQSHSTKRKLSGDGGTRTGSPKHPLLDSIGNRFKQNRDERNMRVAIMESKRETEKQHAQYIKDNIACPVELARAGYIVKEWAKKHGVKEPSKRGTKGRGMPLQVQSRNQLPSSLNNIQNTTQQRAHTQRDTPQRHGNTTQRRSHTQWNTPHSHGNTIQQQEDTHNTEPSSNSNTGNLTKKHTCSRWDTPPGNNTARERDKNSRSSLPSTDNNTATCDPNAIGDDITEFLSGRDDPTEGDMILLDTSVEQMLNDSFDDSVILVNTSNNSATESLESESPTQSNTSLIRSNVQYTCQILNCEAEFSTEAKLGHHTNMFFHSPCNPFIRMLDCKLQPDPILYICPQCEKQFKTCQACQDHMRSKFHQLYLPPLAIAGYLCAQCLCVFDSFTSCRQHIESSSHNDVSYPFANDLVTRPSCMAPILAPEELVKDLLAKCQQTPFRVQCLECDLHIDSPVELRQHSVETNRMHLMSSLADTSIVDVFAEYLAGYRCDTCSRLTSSITTTAVHQCAPGVVGTLVENNIKSFAEFVKCCALTLTKSTDAVRSPTVPNSIAGTSGITGFEIANSHSQARGAIPKTIAGTSKGLTENASHSRVKGAIPKTSDSFDSLTSIPPARKNKARTMVMEEPVQVFKVPSCESELNLCEPLSTDMIDTSTSMSQTRELCNTNSYKRKRTEIDDYPARSDKCRQFPPYDRQLRPPEPALNVLMQGLRDCRPNSAIQGLGLMDTHPQNVARPPIRKPLQSAVPKMAQPAQKAGDDCSEMVSRGRHKSGPPSPRCEELELPKLGPSRQRQQLGLPTHTLQVPDAARRDRSRSPLSDSPISTENLSRMTNIIFLDLDNWAAFFSKLPRCLPDLTFVWGFYGGKMVWNEPHRCYVFNRMKANGMFFLNEQCGYTKDAADFAIVLKVGIMNERLPKSVAFTILSGDKGFCEVERQMKDSERRTVLINPHKAHEFSNDMVYAMVTSVSDT